MRAARPKQALLAALLALLVAAASASDDRQSQMGVSAAQVPCRFGWLGGSWRRRCPAPRQRPAAGILAHNHGLPLASPCMQAISWRYSRARASYAASGNQGGLLMAPGAPAGAGAAAAGATTCTEARAEQFCKTKPSTDRFYAAAEFGCT